MRKAYLGARAKIRETHKTDETYKADETRRAGSVSALVINAEKLVIAYMGDYRAVICRDGVARQISSRDQQSGKRHWSRRLVSGIKHFLTFQPSFFFFKQLREDRRGIRIIRLLGEHFLNFVSVTLKKLHLINLLAQLQHWYKNARS